MSLLLADCLRLAQNVLVPPDHIDSDATTTSINNTVPSGSAVFSLSVSGAGEALGTWAIASASGPASAKLVLSGTTGAAVTLKTTGTMTSSNNGATGVTVKWTAQGGTPVRTISLTINVVTPGTLAFNPSGLGWWDLYYGGGDNLRKNTSGVMRPYDGASHYFFGWDIKAAANDPAWQRNLNGNTLWGRGYDTAISHATGGTSSRGFILVLAVRWWSPRMVPNSSYPAMSAAWPATKAGFQALTRTDFTINPWWPVGTLASDTQADSLDRTRELWDKTGRGWFDDYLMAPWIGANGLIAKLQALNPAYIKVILRPCWECNTIYAPRNVAWGTNVATNGDAIDSGCYGWIQNDSDVALVKACFKNYITILKGISSAASDMFQLALCPLKADYYSNNTPYFKKIHQLNAGETQIFDHIGLDAYDRSINNGPGYKAGSTWQDRWNSFAGATGGVNYQQNEIASFKAAGTASYNLHWGEWNLSSGSGWTDKTAVAPRPTSFLRNGNPVPTYAGSDNPTHVKNLLGTLQAAADARTTADAAPNSMLFAPNQAEYNMDVGGTPASPVYTGNSNKPGASEMFHHIVGLSWNATTKPGADFTNLPTIPAN